MLQKFKGIVLRAKDYGESNQIVQVFSDSRGKISFMARGSKKPKSRFSAVTEPFTEGQFICFVGSGLATLSQGDIIDAHRMLSSDLNKTIYGAYWFEMIERVLVEKEAYPAFYRFLSQMLTQLEEGKNPEILTRIFELRIMEVAGFQPVFHRCVNCRSQKSPFRFSIIQGGFLCVNCLAIDQKALQISNRVAKLLALFQRVEVQRLGNIQVKTDTEQNLKQAIHAFMKEYLDIEFKSRAIIDLLKD